jgi:metallophosphoesterase superfamily enzyme
MKKNYRLRLTEEEYKSIKVLRGEMKSEERNVLVIGDLHTPFDLDEYFDFCVEQYKKYNCNQVIFIGDIIDSHYSSYHEQNPDGMSAGDELELSIKRLKRWYKAFPEATVIIGNHDRIVSRKAVTAGLSSRWIRDFNEVLEVPNWNFVEEFEQDNVVYVHGDGGGTARTRVKNEMQSTVQGHIHTQAYVEWNVGANYKVFGMQVGCGIDRKAYAMAYAKGFKKPVISCGVVLDNGKLPIVITADL